MRATVQRWGNSLALRIPRAFAIELGITPDAKVELSIADGALVVRPTPAGRYALDELLTQVTDENLHAAVDWGAPVGREWP